MFKAALKNYGNFGRHIRLEGHFSRPTRPDCDDYNLFNNTSGLNLMEYLSDKSLEELKHSKDWDTIQQETDSAILNEETQGLLY